MTSSSDIGSGSPPPTVPTDDRRRRRRSIGSYLALLFAIVLTEQVLFSIYHHGFVASEGDGGAYSHDYPSSWANLFSVSFEVPRTIESESEDSARNSTSSQTNTTQDQQLQPVVNQNAVKLISLTSSTTKKNVEHGAVQTFLVPSQPDPTILKHVAYSWTDRNGTLLPTALEDPWFNNLTEFHDMYKNLTQRPETPTCPLTMQLELRIPIDQPGQPWILQSLDQYGQPKTIGGDEYYIAWKSPDESQPIASIVKDLNNGQYEIHFQRSFFVDDGKAYDRRGRPKGDNSILSIDFEYTCRLGTLPQFHKKHWQSGGFSLVRAEIELGAQYVPPIADAIVPNANHEIDLSNYTRVVYFGDSNVQSLVKSIKGILRQKHGMSMDEVEQRVRTTTAQTPLQHKSAERTWLKFGRRYLDNFLNNGTTAFVTGAFTWELIGGVGRTDENRTEHLEALENVMTTLRNEYPWAGLYWYTGLDHHVHQVRVKEFRNLDKLYYCSRSRANELYRQQVDVMNRLGIPMMDSFPATSVTAWQYQTLDARHTGSQLTQQIIQRYYNID